MNNKLKDLLQSLKHRKRSDPIPDKEKEDLENSRLYFMSIKEYRDLKEGNHPFFYLDRWNNLQLKLDYLEVTHKDGKTRSNEIQ